MILNDIFPPFVFHLNILLAVSSAYQSLTATAKTMKTNNVKKMK